MGKEWGCLLGRPPRFARGRPRRFRWACPSSPRSGLSPACSASRVSMPSTSRFCSMGAAGRARVGGTLLSAVRTGICRREAGQTSCAGDPQAGCSRSSQGPGPGGRGRGQTHRRRGRRAGVARVAGPAHLQLPPSRRRAELAPNGDARRGVCAPATRTCTSVPGAPSPDHHPQTLPSADMAFASPRPPSVSGSLQASLSTWWWRTTAWASRVPHLLRL